MKNADSVGTASKAAAATIGLVAALCAASAAAQGIYRCGNSYSQQPCEGARLLEAEDARSHEQRAQSQQAALRDALLAQQLEQARLLDEARVEAYLPFIPEPMPEPAAVARAQPEMFKARAPAEARPKARKSAQLRKKRRNPG